MHIKAGLGSIPLAGALASELFGLIVTPPIEKRRADLLNDITERLLELENRKVIQLDKLSENDQFIDIVLEASTLALRTSQKINSYRI